MIPVRVDPDITPHVVATGRELGPRQPHWPPCPVCDEDLAGPVSLVLVGRTERGWTASAVAVHDGCVNAGQPIAAPPSDARPRRLASEPGDEPVGPPEPVVGCPECGTILNADAASCTNTWHAANRDPWRLEEWQALPGVCLIAACEGQEIDQRGPVVLRDGTIHKACVEHWEPIYRVLGEQASWEREDASRELPGSPRL